MMFTLRVNDVAQMRNDVKVITLMMYACFKASIFRSAYGTNIYQFAKRTPKFSIFNFYLGRNNYETGKRRF